MLDQEFSVLSQPPPAPIRFSWSFDVADVARQIRAHVASEFGAWKKGRAPDSEGLMATISFEGRKLVTDDLNARLSVARRTPSDAYGDNGKRAFDYDDEASPYPQNSTRQTTGEVTADSSEYEAEPDLQV